MNTLRLFDIVTFSSLNNLVRDYFGTAVDSRFKRQNCYFGSTNIRRIRVNCDFGCAEMRLLGNNNNKKQWHHREIKTAIDF